MTFFGLLGLASLIFEKKENVLGFILFIYPIKFAMNIFSGDLLSVAVCGIVLFLIIKFYKK